MLLAVFTCRVLSPTIVVMKVVIVVRVGTYIYTRDPRPPISPYVMALSAMGLKLGVFRFLPTTHAKTNAIQMRP